MNGTVIETHGLTKRYRNGVLAADDVSMTVRQGEIYGFRRPERRRQDDGHDRTSAEVSRTWARDAN
jgi:hypothetical protein